MEGAKVTVQIPCDLCIQTHLKENGTNEIKHILFGREAFQFMSCEMSMWIVDSWL